MLWCTSSTPSAYPEQESLRPAAEGPEKRRGEESEDRGGKGSEEKVEGVGGRKGKRIEGRKGKSREERDQGREYRKGRKIRKERW